jgi:hypothetical protein
MGSTTMKARLLKIDLLRGEAGLWHATSPDMPALHVTERSREEALSQIPIVLEAFCTIGNAPVFAHQVEWKATDDLYWVIVPAERTTQLVA